MNIHNTYFFMLKISKLTDYALVILSIMDEHSIMSASFISDATHIPLPTTNKVLKKLVKNSICCSKNGKMGGFYLSKNKKLISLLEVIDAMEDNNLGVSLTQCSNTHSLCELKKHCKISNKMNLIDKEISQILSKKFISDLT